ncbi:ferritin-like domain-containing protein [Amphibiibacter pelophylacis]|uniref:Ferritin-like domain-containing protein n=1 Tax=Amphibiibacter pelophylacis TaxID=1799477 RepID=A0ACC6P227_9BURK
MDPSPPAGPRQQALAALVQADVDAKLVATQQLWAQWQAAQDGPQADRLAWLDAARAWPEPPEVPGRPARPRLLDPKSVPARNPASLAGRQALLHAIAHIEFNAINLALDAVWRFAGMPEDFYGDWLRVAFEESQHFSLLRDHLRHLGADYGDFDAHDGLWQMTQRTAHDIVARMALVPRTLEARGLDATPPIQARLRQAGDTAAVAILDIILRDEIGHVAIGNRWYGWLCAREGLEPLSHYRRLARQYAPPRLRPPINWPAREAAGFTEAELAWLRQEVG